MKFETKYKLTLWKTYFDKGMGITQYVKYMIAFFGLASQDISTTLIIGVIYFFSCLLLGHQWYEREFALAEREVSNQYNLFVKEVRKKLIKKRRQIKS